MDSTSGKTNPAVEKNDEKAEEANTNKPDIPETSASTEEPATTRGCSQDVTADSKAVNSDDAEHVSPRAGSDNVESIVVSSRSPTSLSTKIPKKKRRRLESSFGEKSDNNFLNTYEDESNAPMDVSLNQLKRQVLGRDLKTDDEEQNWEDEEDTELRQIRALMNASNESDGDQDLNKNTNTKYSEEIDAKCSGVPSQNPSPSSLSLLSEKLRKDLMCAICHEVLYPPVALQCGHSFCQPCIDWWLDHDDAGRCPTCRRRSYPGTKKTHTICTSPNLALRACVMAMFGPEIILRLQNRKKLRPKGERGGFHDEGYQILSELQDETWHYVSVRTDDGTIASNSTTIQVRRSIVLDADDQRMQLALAVYQKPFKEVRSAPNDKKSFKEPSGRFHVELCLLSMEEDEAADSGFPTNIISPDDEFFLCGGNHGSSRFRYSYLDVQMRDENGRHSPLARVSANANDGRFKYVLDPAESVGNATTEIIRTLLFKHSETGLQLEIDLAQLQNRAGGSYLLPPNQSRTRIQKNHLGLNYRDDLVMERHDETKEDDEFDQQDEYEDDGFLVGDDESNVEGAFSDEEDVDDDDRCAICKDGGELMICDGGDKHPGCGKSFHAACVDRSTIPDGDWICQACAETGGIKTGITGHEFTKEKTSDITRGEMVLEGDASSSVVCDVVDDGSGVEGTFSDDEENTDENQEMRKADEAECSLSSEQPACEEDSIFRQSGNSNNRDTKRRFVLEDSDSE